MAEKFCDEEQGAVEAAGGLDPDAAEAAALAHDLGHPPFGHLAESVLDDLCRNAGGFEGNAQSFRIVTTLAVGDGLAGPSEPVRGLNLSRATLNGILKYPWMRGGNANKPKKYGAYSSEYEQFSWARGSQPFSTNVKSLEAELMDWADDITFSVHDLIDFYCAGQIPLEILSAKTDGEDERATFFDEVFERCPELGTRRVELEAALSGILEYFTLTQRYIGSRDQRCELWQFATILISRYVAAIRVAPDALPARCVAIKSSAEDEVRMLKELTWHYVILHNDLATDQHGKRRMVETVFTELQTAASRESWNVFPPFFKEQLRQGAGDSSHRTRTVVDYIASMTERELTRVFQLLTGSH
jgi:dGTPase